MTNYALDMALLIKLNSFIPYFIHILEFWKQFLFIYLFIYLFIFLVGLGFELKAL
jgi:hypothetical protein